MLDSEDELAGEAQAEEQGWEDSGSPVSVLPPLPPGSPPSPPPLPLSPPEDFVEQTPEPTQAEDAPPASPVTPPHVPLDTIPVGVHGWIMTGMMTDLAVARGRLEESRLQLAAERTERLRVQRGRRVIRPQTFRREVSRIERRARARIRALQTDGGGRVSRDDAEEIVRLAMIRVRALSRPRG